MVFINLPVNYVNILAVKNFVRSFYVWEGVEKDDLIFIIIFGHIIVVSARPGAMIKINKRSLEMRLGDFLYLLFLMQNN